MATATATSTSVISIGALVTLQGLTPSSPYFKQGASLPLTRKLQKYNVDTAIASIAEGNASLEIDTQHLNVNLRIGSLYQFVGELLIIMRNADGMDLKLDHRSLQLLRDFQAEQNNSTTY